MYPLPHWSIDGWQNKINKIFNTQWIKWTQVLVVWYTFLLRTFLEEQKSRHKFWSKFPAKQDFKTKSRSKHISAKTRRAKKETEAGKRERKKKVWEGSTPEASYWNYVTAKSMESKGDAKRRGKRSPPLPRGLRCKLLGAEFANEESQHCILLECQRRLDFSSRAM